MTISPDISQGRRALRCSILSRAAPPPFRPAPGLPCCAPTSPSLWWWEPCSATAGTHSHHANSRRMSAPAIGRAPRSGPAASTPANSCAPTRRESCRACRRQVRAPAGPAFAVVICLSPPPLLGAGPARFRALPPSGISGLATHCPPARILVGGRLQPPAATSTKSVAKPASRPASRPHIRVSRWPRCWATFKRATTT